MAMTPEERQEARDGLLAILRQEAVMLGARLPGETELCWRLTSSRHLVRVILKQLETEGIIERRARSGSYLLRRPESGPIPVSARSLAPVKTGSRTVSVMLASHVPEATLRDLQSVVMADDYLLQFYFGPEHAASPREERIYLKKAIRNGYCGALIHPTPLPPANDAFFREAAAHIRLAHIGYHSLDLPEQSFFLPDLTFAGNACAHYLVHQGCRRLRLISSLPADHHVTQLIARGVVAAAAPMGLPTSITSLYSPNESDARRATAKGRDEGLVLYHDERLAILTDAARRIALSGPSGPRAVWIREQSDLSPPSEFPSFVFDWQAQVLDALRFIIANTESVCHRLYLPTFHSPA